MKDPAYTPSPLPPPTLSLTGCRNIERLPEDPPTEGDETPEQLARYEELRNALIRNTTLLKALRRKHAYYSQVREYVRPFENPAESVQSNLVTSQGRIGEELAEMKILAAKLAATIQETRMRKKREREKEGQEVEGVEEGGEEKRLKAILGL